MVANIKTRAVGVSAALDATGPGTITARSGGSSALASLVSDPGFTPVELMDAALAGCLVLSVRIAARRRDWAERLQHVDASVRHDKAQEGRSRIGTFTCNIEIKGDFSAEERALLIADAHEICTVGNTIEQGAIIRDDAASETAVA